MTYNHVNAITISRDSSLQVTHRPPVMRGFESRDLIFFAYEQEKGRVHHLGMYVNTSTHVSIDHVDLSGYVEEYRGARKVLEE